MRYPAFIPAILVAVAVIGLTAAVLMLQRTNGVLITEMKDVRQSIALLEFQSAEKIKALEDAVTRQKQDRTRSQNAAAQRLPAESYSYDSDQTQSTAVQENPAASENSLLIGEERNVADEEQQAASSTSEQDSFTIAEMLFDSEQIDDGWAADSQDEIYQLLQDEESFRGVNIDEIDCRSSTCRLVVTIDDSKTELHTLPMLIGELGKNFPEARLKNSGDRLTLLLNTIE